MAQNVIMPQLGESIAEGTIVKWLKNEGDVVKKDENILLISTDKVEAEIPSPCDGYLTSIAVGPGQTVAVGTVLGQVSETNVVTKSKPAASVKEAPKQVAQEVYVSKPAMVEPQRETCSMQREESSGSLAGFFSPLVRKIASEENVSVDELDRIKGTGLSGRVSKKDLLSYLETRQPMKTPAIQQQFTAQPTFEPKYNIDFKDGERESVKPISTMRKVIMENMIASKRTSAHVTTFFEIDYTSVDNIRKKWKDAFLKQEGVALTYTTFLALAVCQTLKRHPFINASLDQDKIIFKKDVHLGMAVSIDQPEPGLMVPVIKNADKQNLRGLAHAISDLSTRVRNKKIKPDELFGGSFTITNPGNYGALIGTPIINQPQVAILGVGQIKKTVQVLEFNGVDTIGIRNTGLLSLSFDHRLIDGATADIFMADLKKTLENWTTEP